jgi:hypothetical protein
LITQSILEYRHKVVLMAALKLSLKIGISMCALGSS